MPQSVSIYSIHVYHAIFTKNVTLGESLKVLSEAIWSVFTPIFLSSEALPLAYIT